MIELHDVTAHRGGQLALREVSLHIDPGTVTAVIGPNGAGKSTLFGLISGRLRPTSGRIAVGGAVAEVLQSTVVDPQVRLTVRDVVCMGRYPTCGTLRRFRRADRSAVDAALAQVALSPLTHRTLDELSGGQRQRALIAQGIAQDAPVVLFDEPAAGLDGVSQRRILDVLRELADAGRTVVFSTHHLPDVECADTVVALSCECICCAPPGIASQNDAVRSLFDPFADNRAVRQAHLQQAEADSEPIPLDAAAARSFGQIAASLRRAGRMPTARAHDAMIAAIATSRGLPVHTCNPADFDKIGDLEVVAGPHPDH